MSISANNQTGTIVVTVRDDDGAGGAIANAPVRIFALTSPPADTKKSKLHTPSEYADECDGEPEESGSTDANGQFVARLSEGWKRIEVQAFGFRRTMDAMVTCGCDDPVSLNVPVGFAVETFAASKDGTTARCDHVRQGSSMYVRFIWNKLVGRELRTALIASKGAIVSQYRDYEEDRHIVREYVYDSRNVFGHVQFTASLKQNPEIVLPFNTIIERDEQIISGKMTVSNSRTETEATQDLPLWIVIRNSTDALSFNKYETFLEALLCKQEGLPLTSPGRKAFNNLSQRRALPFTDSEAYRILKAATEAFVMVNCGVLTSMDAFDPEVDNAYLGHRDLPSGDDLATVFQNYLEPVNGHGTMTLPYLAIIRRKLPDIPILLSDRMQHEADICLGFVQDKLANPCLLELIWSYWQEEGMLVQTMNAITRRFQNVRSSAASDPLSNLEIDPLRPLNNLLWGYTQDEQHRLTVSRRNCEYDHHYGLRLEGKAVQSIRMADSRSKFLEAFHHLLRLCTVFYKQDDDTTVKADAFPVLNALKEVHLILSQGAHNQFGDLPSTARTEMLMQQWLLSRPEFREFLPTRIMVAYPEPWMERVDAMKKLQGWSDTSVMQFHTLAVFGEQLLLSIRYGAWSKVYEPTQAFNWARFWRPQVQGYIHAYRAATGVELAGEKTPGRVDATLPSVLIRNRLAEQHRTA